MSDESGASLSRADHLRVFAARLGQAGYAPKTVRTKIRVVAGLLRVLEAGGSRVGDLDERQVDAVVARKRWRSRKGHRRTLLQFLGYLRERGIAARQRAGEDDSPAARLEQRYVRHLREERGLATGTLTLYRSFVCPFLDDWFRHGRTTLSGLTHRDVTKFLLRHVTTVAPKTAQAMGTALRSFLRFAFLEAQTGVDLSFAIPTVRQFRKATVPSFLSTKDVERVIASCDTATPVGRRNRALLLLLARLGLRAGEIVRLELGDLRWRGGELVVRGKGQVHDLLPLPEDVGEALALYLTRDRPACSSRRVFLRMRAPLRGFTGPAAVTTVVERALGRTGLHPARRGSHLLRHSLATGMIQRGATMAEIGQVLRHRSPNTTELYAKVDFERLRGIALPWPKAGGGR